MKHTKPYRLLLLLAAGLILLAGCASDDDIANGHKDTTPITFSANVNTAVTRAVGDDTDKSQNDTGTGSITYSQLSRYGFGVFAYDVYDGNWINKKVYKGEEANPELGDVHEHTANWSYGETEIMWGKQRISFLAYAPYVDETSETGIKKVTGSSVDDTKIEYTIATNPTQGVDLLWGVREDANKADAKRLPWLNTAVTDGAEVENIASGGGITFSFHHALTAIGFHVQAMIDKDNDQGDFEDESNVGGILTSDGGDYKITLKSITLSGDFYEKADLYLKNEISGKPEWKKHSDSNEKEDLAEADLKSESLIVASEHIKPAFSHPTDIAKADGETQEAFRERIAKVIIENEIENKTITGITQKAEQLVIIPHSKTGAEQCFFVIPNEKKEDYTLTIEWCVSHRKYTGTDNNGNKTYSYEAEDRTTKIQEALKGWALNPETKYYLNLVFGLKSVRLNVTATDWKNNPINIEDIIENGTSASESLSRPTK